MYDCIIIGCGPSGMTCALYLKRAGKNALVLERSMPGGQMVITTNVENYPGIMHIDGASLATQMFEQITNLGVNVLFEDVTSCDLSGDTKIVKTDKNQYAGKTVYIATGATNRLLNVEGEKKFTSKGVSYCATCDGALYKNKNVAVVGGGNTSLEDCLYLSNVAKKIYLIHRRDEFRGDDILVQKIKKLEREGKIELVLNSQVVEILGDEKVKSIKVLNKITSQTKTIDVDALFVAIGRKPDTEMFEGIDVDESGYIKVDKEKNTNISGVFCGGDVSNTELRQIVTACGDGARASISINSYLAKHNHSWR